MSALLDVTGLQIAYDGRTVLENIHAEFHPGRVTAVVGPSGCGKSTLLKAMNRTLELTPGARQLRGEIRFRGGSLHEPGVDLADLRRRIGLIQQRPVVFPMSIRENALFGLRYHGHWDGRGPDAAAREHLEQAGLWDEVRDRLDEPASTLSGGQQQRLCIARTLANRPDVILMDEPCSSLDPKATRTIEDLIGRLRERLGIVVVTHNLAQARRIAQDAIVLLDGRVAECGEASRVLTNPNAEAARDFIQGFAG